MVKLLSVFLLGFLVVGLCVTLFLDSSTKERLAFMKIVFWVMGISVLTLGVLSALVILF